MSILLIILAGAVPMFNQFANVPPPSSIANLPGLETVFEPRSTAPQQFHQDPSVNLLDFYQLSNERRGFFSRDFKIVIGP